MSGQWNAAERHIPALGAQLRVQHFGGQDRNAVVLHAAGQVHARLRVRHVLRRGLRKETAPAQVRVAPGELAGARRIGGDRTVGPVQLLQLFELVLVAAVRAIDVGGEVVELGRSVGSDKHHVRHLGQFTRQSGGHGCAFRHPDHQHAPRVDFGPQQCVAHRLLERGQPRVVGKVAIEIAGAADCRTGGALLRFVRLERLVHGHDGISLFGRERYPRIDIRRAVGRSMAGLR